MNKLIYVIILLLFIVGISFLLPQGSAELETKHYQKGEISFDYPANWEEVQAKGSQVAAFKDPQTGYIVTINRQIIPPNYTYNENFVIQTPDGVENKFKPINQQKNNISGVLAYENIYNINLNGSSINQYELWLQKNNAFYSVIYKSSPNLPWISSKSSAEFNIIKKSLKVNNTQLNKTPVIGTVYIPKLNVKWDIRYDTVNALNAVYHYKESFYAGQDGSFGLLGHHTTYSAPFNNLETLKQGDIVEINDYVTQKKYVYEVLTNDDIRYDYTTNKITFQPKSRELILATCWPPGSTAAEIYIHGQLLSVEPL